MTDTWTGTSMTLSGGVRQTVTAAEVVSEVARIPHGLLLTMRTTVWGYDRPEEFADRENLRKRIGAGEPLYYRLRFYQPGVVRIELLDAEGLATEKRNFFLAELTPLDFTVSAEDEFAVDIAFGDFRFHIEKGTRGRGYFRFSVLDADGNCHFETENQDDGMVLFNYPPGKRTDQATGASWFRESIALRPEEKIYGFGEKFHPLDKRNRDVRIWQTDAAGCLRDAAYKNIPFFLSSRRYGALFNSPRAMRFEVGSQDCSSIGADVFDDRVDYVLMPAHDLQSVLRDYAALTGQPTLPPRWSFGLWMSKCTYSSETELDEVVGKFREYDLPLTTMHIDTGWFDVIWLCDWQFNSERFPDPAAMVKRYRDDGLRISLWQLPYVNAGGAAHRNPAFDEGRDGGYFALDDAGEIYVARDQAKDTPLEGVIDFFNPTARRWYQSKIRALLEMGISAIKTDFGESAPCKAHYQHIDGADMHNLYPRLYNEAVWEVFQEGYAQQPITWARSATVGCQTMPVHWGGDPSALWPHLAGSLWGALSFGLSGGLFWSCDIGGFGGARQPDEELYTRWLQFGAFNSHMRVHGNMEREPWKFGETALAVFRKFTKLRYRLLPYLLSEAQYAVETMRPMMCAMPLAFPDDPICEGIGDQYMFGRALLIAPLLTAGGTRRVYLPAGTWFDFWSKEKISGGRYINV
ncbi:MAG TPA: TIM-barrel domain-containing protein, partial [Armatimonadota bacterium]